MAVSTTPLFTFDHAAVIHNADGTKSLRWNMASMSVDAKSNRVLSLQPNGAIEDRPIEKPSPDYAGPWGIRDWEKGNVEREDRLIFRTGDARLVFGWQD